MKTLFAFCCLALSTFALATNDGSNFNLTIQNNTNMPFKLTNEQSVKGTRFDPEIADIEIKKKNSPFLIKMTNAYQKPGATFTLTKKDLLPPPISIAVTPNSTDNTTKVLVIYQVSESKTISKSDQAKITIDANDDIKLE